MTDLVPDAIFAFGAHLFGPCRAELDEMEWTEPPPRDAVIAAGERLRAQIDASEAQGAADAFATAHAWLEAHLLPLHALRLSLHQHSKVVDPAAIVAGRIKRLSSIRKKLRRSGVNLWDIQDVAGARAIVRNMDDVRAIVGRYERDGSKHRLARQDDYITSPKASGYRSHHLLMRFNGLGGRESFHRRSVELQVRTRHQHAWATAIEAVGLMRGEDLKGGCGDAYWLRFFVLMADEIAAAEDCPSIPGAAAPVAARREELIALQKHLNAVETMIGYSSAIQRVKALGRMTGTRFVIRFERAKGQVTVTPFHNHAGSMRGVTGSDGDDGTEVFVAEVDGIDSLAAAYPNYMMDVGLFVSQVRRSLSRGKNGIPDLSWLNTWRW